MKLELSAVLSGGEHILLQKKELPNGADFVLPHTAFAHADTLSITSPAWDASAKDAGYYLIPGTEHSGGSAVTFFRERTEGALQIKNPLLSFFAVGTADATVAVLIDRYYFYSICARCKDGRYHIELSFDLTDQIIEDDIVLHVLSLPAGADFNAVARRVREYHLASGRVRPLKDRCAERPMLDYSRRHPVVRVRMGWKPVPPTVLHQTPENEPPMLVACTFADVRKIADECKRQGLAGAEFCLVGWNQKGHDGRWPQIFPVEEALGGEAELKATVAHVKALGYHITCHTNSIDHYEIADSFHLDEVAHAKDGTPRTCGMWAGGEAFHACPEVQLTYARKDLPKVRALGFEGLHYIDVLSIVPPDVCFHPDHPCTLRRGIACLSQIMKLATELFGGFSSEGSFDYALSGLDFSLYNSFGTYAAPALASEALADLVVPLVELIYHGIVLYNPNAATVNYTVKGKDEAVTLALYGGRPSFYYFSKFIDSGSNFLQHVGTNWMGNTDLLCRTDEEISHSVSAIVRAAEEYRPFAERQLVFMHSFEQTENGLRAITYEDGVTVVGNYTDAPLPYRGVTVPPHEYRVLESEDAR